VRWWIVLGLGVAAAGLLVAALFYWRGEETVRGVAESTTPAALKPVEAPSFSVLSLGADGALSASGLAAPGSTVTLSIDGKPRVQLRADERGEWVLVLAEAFRPGDHGVTLDMRLPDARELASDSMAVVSAPRRSFGAPFIALVRKDGPSRLLQAPGGAGGPSLLMEATDYRSDGSALLSGRAEPGATVHVFRGELALGTAQTGGDGRWALAADAALLAEDAEDSGDPNELRLVILDEAGNDRARVGVPLPLPPGQFALAETAYARIIADGKQWRIGWRDGEGQVHRTTIYAADATRAIDPLPTPEPRP
jgi:hypothetical protein